MEITASVHPNVDVINERQPGAEDAHITEPNQVQSQTLFSSYIDVSHTTASTSSTSCPHSSGKEPCDNSSQPHTVINGETTDQLHQLRREHTEDQVNPHMDSREETGSTSTTIASVSSVLGIPFLFFTLYKVN